jgi:glutamate-1-semialdehyde 2,1-aminomutase
LLDRGVYLPPAQLEAGFISAAHTETDIDALISAAESALTASAAART